MINNQLGTLTTSFTVLGRHVNILLKLRWNIFLFFIFLLVEEKLRSGEPLLW